MTRLTRNNFAPLIRLRSEQCAINGQQMLVLSLIEDWKKNQYYDIPMILCGFYHATIGYNYNIGWALTLATICFTLFTVCTVIFNLQQISKGKNARYSFAESIWFYPSIVVLPAIVIALWFSTSRTLSALFLKRQITLVLISYLLSIVLFLYHHHQYHMLEERRLKYKQRYEEAVAWFNLST
jgi:energy-converting hydrogenase Eha subunit A